MRSILILLIIFTAHVLINGQTRDDQCDKTCIQITESLLVSARTGFSTSWLEKSNREMGDQIILGIKHVVSEKEMFEVSNVRLYLQMIREAFADTNMIRNSQFRSPVRSIEFLCLVYKNVKDDETKKDVKSLMHDLLDRRKTNASEDRLQ